MLINDIEAHIADAESALREANTAAVAAATSPAARLKAARNIVERREVLAILRQQLADARALARAAEEAAAKQKRVDNRARMTALAADALKEAKALERDLEKAAGRYAKMTATTREIVELSTNADGIRPEIFRSTHPMQAPYALALVLIAKAFGFHKKEPLGDGWTPPFKQPAAIKSALSVYDALIDSTEEDDEAPVEYVEAPVEYVEATPEGIENHAV